MHERKPSSIIDRRPPPCEVARLDTRKSATYWTLIAVPSPLAVFVLPPSLLFSTTLDWVHGLQPDDLEKFLAEKKEQRMRVLCLDLEPTGIPQQVCPLPVLRCLCVSLIYSVVHHTLHSLGRELLKKMSWLAYATPRDDPCLIVGRSLPLWKLCLGRAQPTPSVSRPCRWIDIARLS